MVINNWLLFGLDTPKADPISGSAGYSASIDNATIDINAAIKATNSNSKVCLFCIRQMYVNIIEKFLIYIAKFVNN